MTLPSRLRAAIGIAEGDLVEAIVHRGKIVLTPKLVVDRSKFPNADDEYTPAQRRDARMASDSHPRREGREGREG
jgi:bifunctional DNA-binding transcriptional regulator/antitoxin component of YhaV-PrlF toxin-antitoxin module